MCAQNSCLKDSIGMGGKHVNKAELIEALAGRLGDRKSATAALDAVLAEIQSAVTKGDKVSITGFGVFEKRVRAARTARNPRTGEAVKVKKTSVPAFRAGAGFKDMVAAGKVPKVAKAAAAVKKAAPTRATAVKKAAAAPAKKAAAAPAKKATRAASTTTTRTTATARATTAKATPTATKATRARTR
jgi:DNA-binding protein HU-beta